MTSDMPNPPKAGRSYLDVRGEIRPGAKTVVIHVHSKSHGDRLGTIRWYGAWRQYIFEPTEAIFSEGCLKEIEAYLRGANAKQREMWAAARNG